MLRKNIKYVDYNGVERSEDFYFNLTKTEVMRMQSSVKGGYDAQLKSIASDPETNGMKVIEFFDNLIRKSYGVKSEDGRRFEKSEALTEAFTQSPAYEALFDELATNDNAAAIFVNGVMPSDLARKAE